MEEIEDEEIVEPNYFDKYKELKVRVACVLLLIRMHLLCLKLTNFLTEKDSFSALRKPDLSR